MIEKLTAVRQRIVDSQSKPFEFSNEDPRRLKPLSLEQQKKRARELLNGLKRKDLDALDRLNKYHPEKVETARLHDAQLIIACETGFKKWEELKAHIETAKVEREALASGEPSALDDKKKTLHIRCGSDIKEPLARAGFTGGFLDWLDLYVLGSVPQTKSLKDFLKIRAQVIADQGWDSYENVLKRFTDDYAELDQAKNYDQVMLWFEHDSHDMLIIAMLLDFFSDPKKRPLSLKLVCVTDVPGVEIFNGIGQLPPEALRVIWQQFEEVTSDQYELGKKVWAAIKNPDPTELYQLIEKGTPALIPMAKALRRHLQELPSVHNGLCLTEELTLKILAEKGSMNAARLFGWYTNHYEPLTFMGDSSYWKVLSGLADVDYPAIQIENSDGEAKDWEVRLSEIGRSLIKNTENWLVKNTVNRWVGGIEINNQKSCWCWDHEAQEPVLMTL